MQTASELTVILKYENSTYKEKFLLYDQYTLSYDDIIIGACIKQALAACNGEKPEQIKIKISLEWE